ncbi:uncharacterized protein LOC142356954 [Convolutriloba macropyga]|uniref:uncharacterized protein LOC142356954 n=1 Tax=Convolutriloba macropyga TaxID=536237 RepID=UPI003F51D090
MVRPGDREACCPPGLLDLPTEALLLVLTKLSAQSLFCLQLTCKELAIQTKSDDLWRDIAIAKWGLLAADQEVSSSWFPYCKHRMSLRTVAPSPLCLIQEDYTDPWQHLVCCICCSRTSGSPLIRLSIDQLLREYPSPSDVVAANVTELKALLHPLGLQDARCKSLQAMSRAFLLTDWTEPSEFYGCGKFVSDSWRIFCQGERCLKGVEDQTLRRYLSAISKDTAEIAAKPPAARRVGRKQKRKASAPEFAAPVKRVTRNSTATRRAAALSRQGAEAAPLPRMKAMASRRRQRATNMHDHGCGPGGFKPTGQDSNSLPFCDESRHSRIRMHIVGSMHRQRHSGSTLSAKTALQGYGLTASPHRLSILDVNKGLSWKRRSEGMISKGPFIL